MTPIRVDDVCVISVWIIMRKNHNFKLTVSLPAMMKIKPASCSSASLNAFLSDWLKIKM